MKNLPTLEDITATLDCVCAACGGEAAIYPYPQPEGSCVCIVCTPEWFRAFVRDMSARVRSGELRLERY